MEGGHCVRAVHAEIRAISRAAKAGVVLNESTAFVTLLPCIQCMQALMLCGVREIYYDEVYDRPEKEHVHLLAEQGGIRLTERTRS